MQLIKIKFVAIDIALINQIGDAQSAKKIVPCQFIKIIRIPVSNLMLQADLNAPVKFLLGNTTLDSSVFYQLP
jgi:hypothetical protein